MTELHLSANRHAWLQRPLCRGRVPYEPILTQPEIVSPLLKPLQRYFDVC